MEWTPLAEPDQTADPDADPPSSAVERVEAREWDHDHRELCWDEFMAGDYPPEQRERREEQPEILTAGYTLARPERSGHWI